MYPGDAVSGPDLRKRIPDDRGRPERTPCVPVRRGLLDFEIVWLWPERSTSLCSCPVSPDTLERTLAELPAPPAAVYLTSPDYLGGMADISALAEVCRKHSTLLAVDNAHGAYLRFLEPSRHPLDLGAALCCDSAHKTLPVLTGGAYLHISRAAPASLRENAKTAMAMFGSTSPVLSDSGVAGSVQPLPVGWVPERLREMCVCLDEARKALTAAGWQDRAVGSAAPDYQGAVCYDRRTAGRPSAGEWRRM